MKTLRIGDTLKDNDVRMGVRFLTVTAVGIRNGLAIRAMSPVGREVEIAVKRIYTDGKPRKSGFDRVADRV